MIEIRKDIISNREVIINEVRSFRPHEVNIEEAPNKSESCVFCPGNEDKTPPEISRFEDKKGWTVRVFPNKFPIVTLQKFKPLEDNSWKGHGANEVIVLTPKHNESPFDFSINKWDEIIRMYKQRIIENSEIEDINYVLVIHNHGAQAGASLVHSHSQLVSLPFTPRVIAEEAKSCKEKLCCKMVSQELKSNRLVFKNKEFIVFTNFASRYPFETHVYPLKHIKSVTELSEESIHSLSEALNVTFKAFKKEFKVLDYNYVIHDAPKNSDYHFHIEIYPQINRLGGVEHGVNVNINNVSPENAAKILRSVMK